MAITLTAPSDEILLSGNPIIYGISGTQYVSNDGVFSVLEWEFTAGPANNNTFTFEADFLQGGTVVFTAKTLPVNDNEFGRPPAGILSASYIQEVVIPALLSNPVIANNYDVSFNGDLGIIMTALVHGGEYDLTLTSSGSNTSIISSTNGAFLELTPNYLLRYRIHLETAQDSGIFKRGEWFFVKPNIDGEIEIDISPKVHEMFNETDDESPTGSTPVKAVKSMRSMRLEVAEHFGANPFNSNSKISFSKRVLRGAFDADDIGESFYTKYVAARKPITNKGQKEPVHPDQPQWLHFVMNHTPLSGGDTTIILARVYYTDGTNTNDIQVNTSSIVWGELWKIPCGFNQLGLGAFEPTKTPYKYTVRAYSALAIATIMEEVTFLLPTNSSFANVVHYKNAFGLQETLCFEGEHKHLESVQRQRALIERPLEPQKTDRDAFDYGIVRRTAFELSTTALPRTNVGALVDCLLSRVHWVQMLSRGGEMLAAKILTDGAELPGRDKDGNHITAARIAFELNESKGNTFDTANG